MNSSHSIFHLYSAVADSGRDENDSSRDSDGCLTSDEQSSSFSLCNSAKSPSDDSFFSEGPALLEISQELIDELTNTPPVPPCIRKARRGGQHRSVEFSKHQLLQLKRRVRRLEDENEALKDYTVSVILDKERTTDDLFKLRTSYHEELGASKTTRQQLDRLHEEFLEVNKRLTEAERFILDMADLKLDTPVLEQIPTSHAQESSGKLPCSIHEMILSRRSTWLKLLPAPEGPRTLDHYLSALNLVINARREIREHQRVAQFWKSLAKSDPHQADTVTPSTSELDNLEPLDSVRPPAQVLDDLLRELKQTMSNKRESERSTPSHILPLSTSESESTSSKFALSSLIRDGVACPNVAEPSDDVDNRATTPPCPTLSHVPIISTPPKSLERPSNIPRRSPGKYTNVTPAPRRTIITHGKMPSLAAIAKRLSIVDPPLQTLDCISSRESEPQHSSPFRGAAPSSRSMKGVSFPPATKQRFSHILHNSKHSSGPNPLNACQALLSLERICSAFSSTSLGSLETSEEEEQQTSNGKGRPTAAKTQLGKRDLEDLSCSLANSSGASLRTPTTTMAKRPSGSKPADPPSGTTAKSVRWAIPLSPDHPHFSRPSHSSSSSASGSESPSPSKEPTIRSLGRKRSSSSPTPPGRSMGDSAKSSISRTMQVLKPRPTLPLPPLLHSTAVPLDKPRGTALASISTGGRSRLPASSSHPPSRSKKSIPPGVPPKSPLRLRAGYAGEKVKATPTSATTPGTQDTNSFPQPSSSTASNQAPSSIPTAKIPASSPDSVKLTSLQQAGSKSNVQIYDYTQPIMPLKVVKKKTPMKQNGSNMTDASAPPVTSTKPLQPAGHHLYSKALQPGSSKRLSTDLNSTLTDVQVKRLKPGNIIPPIRTSSLRPPKIVQATLRPPLQSLLQNSSLSINKPQESVSTSRSTLKANPGPTIDVPPPHEIDPMSTSPLSRLRMVVKPPGAIAIRPITKSYHK